MKAKTLYQEWKEKAKKGILPTIILVAIIAFFTFKPKTTAFIFIGIIGLFLLVGLPYVAGDIVEEYKKEKEDES